jgi:CheY-like chemotaxis protein
MTNRKILLVDDNEDHLLITQRILARGGYEILTAISGAEALDIFTQRKSELFVVVLDILLLGSDGRKVALKMKAAAPDVHIIFFTQYGFRDMLSKWGVEDIDYVMKDDEEKLVDLIKKYEKF